MDADDYLKQYLPDFDTAGKRAELQRFSREDLVEMPLLSYKQGRVSAIESDVLSDKLQRIATIVQEHTGPPSVDRPPPNFPED